MIKLNKTDQITRNSREPGFAEPPRVRHPGSIRRIKIHVQQQSKIQTAAGMLFLRELDRQAFVFFGRSIPFRTLDEDRQVCIAAFV
jgi:hypothetical protein